MNIRAVVRYDGSRFHGWQVQPDQRTVQGELIRVLSMIAGERIMVQGASRTDAGVHALGQVCSFYWPDDKPVDRLRHALCSLLQPDIEVVDLRKAPPDFHARHSSRGKRYAYTLHFSRYEDPFCARYAWRIEPDIDIMLIKEILPRLEGEHDFAGFQSMGSPASGTVRVLHAARLLKGGAITAPVDVDSLWRIELYGDAFLYHMVRNIVGTVVEIARGRYPQSWLEERLHSPGPFRGLCAPAHGLALLRVYYDDDVISS